MRSLLFVPADSERKLTRAMSAGADMVILDLEDSVAPANKPDARERAVAFLTEHRRSADRPLLYVRINGLATGIAEADLDAVVPAGPDGIVLPKSESGADVGLLSAMLGAREALAGLADGAVKIVAIASEIPAALFTLGSYGGRSARLAGLTWGAEDLSAAVGAETSRTAEGVLADPYRLARSLCLFGAAAARVAAIDTVFTRYRDGAGLEDETLAARRDGFTAKLAIHPDQVPVINRVFSPSAEAIAEAHAIVAAFAEAGDAGVVAFGGRMLDRPHLLRAERLLARAKAARPI